MSAQVEGLAARQPVLMVCEDVHWSDPTTRKLLDRSSTSPDAADPAVPDVPARLQSAVGRAAARDMLCI